MRVQYSDEGPRLPWSGLGTIATPGPESGDNTEVSWPSPVRGQPSPRQSGVSELEIMDKWDPIICLHVIHAISIATIYFNLSKKTVKPPAN